MRDQFRRVEPGSRPVKVEPWPEAKQQRAPTARADLDAVVWSGLPAVEKLFVLSR